MGGAGSRADDPAGTTGQEAGRERRETGRPRAEARGAGRALVRYSAGQEEQVDEGNGSVSDHEYQADPGGRRRCHLSRCRGAPRWPVGESRGTPAGGPSLMVRVLPVEAHAPDACSVAARRKGLPGATCSTSISNWRASERATRATAIYQSMR